MQPDHDSLWSYRAEATGVILEKGLLGKTRWIERAFPMIVMPTGRADVGSCAYNPYFRRTDLSLTNFRYEPLFLWRSHANLQGPAYPGRSSIQ